MRTKTEIQNELDNVEMELRSLMDTVKDTSKDVNLEEVRSKRDEFVTRRNSLNKELAECDKPQAKVENENVNSLFKRSAWLDAVREKRALEIGNLPNATIGSVNQIKTLFKEIAEGDDILKNASYYYGKDASTNIPVLSPLTDPEGYGEGKTGITDRANANIDIAEIQPKAYVSILPITAEMLTMGSVDLESELPELFGKAFRRVMHSGMMTGVGTDKTMKGMFVSALSNTDGVTKLAGNKITVTELSKLALTVSAKDEPYTIVMNPSVYQGILSDASSSEDIKIYKEGLIRDKSIEGVKILLDNRAPSATSAGSVLAVAVPLSRYAIGIANDLVIEPVKVLGDTNTYFQATMFFSGKQISDKDILSLAVNA